MSDVPAAVPVLVVGAGPTGLALALTLTRAGTAVRVVDQRTGSGRESRALDVQARTLELYRQLGVAEAVVARGVRVEVVAVREHGRRLAAVDVREIGEGVSPYPYLLCCPQDEHEDALAEAVTAAGVRVEWGTRLEAAAEERDRVQVRLSGPAGSEQLGVGYLAGCDGARSTARDLLGVGFAGRATAGSPDRGSEQTYFVADVAAPSARVGSFTFCLSAADFVLAVPARRGGTERLVGLVPPGLADRDDLAFDALRPMVEMATGAPVGRVRWFSTYRVSSRVADRLRVGRCFLLGDAAHLHSPLGGQGMNTGIADAVNLGWKLAAVLDGRATPGLLDSYDAERRPVARRLVTGVDTAFRLVAGPGRSSTLARRFAFGRLLPALLRSRALRRAVSARVSQLAVHYRRGPLSGGRAGRVRGGDRLPWVPLPDGASNHDALTRLDWQLHVHGAATPSVRRLAGDRGLGLDVRAWTAAARRAGFRRDALYLVRPDGYVAVASPGRDLRRLTRLLDHYQIRPRGQG
ncbi:FAD-dependent monooxygenase [uncultured Friedmanniella sp.]|uniref:FAD-dependent monooxygenase n=1 Tax=uncultured Friedmanniella sp. TaxID=335381 RepID=UPI0035C97E84